MDTSSKLKSGNADMIVRRHHASCPITELRAELALHEAGPDSATVHRVCAVRLKCIGKESARNRYGLVSDVYRSPRTSPPLG